MSLVALVLSYWGWRWLGPAPLPPPRMVDDGEWATRIAGAHLFGGVNRGAAPASLSNAGNDARLVGTFAQRGGRGYALFRLKEGPRLLAVGESLPDGLHLDAVRPDEITVSDGGKQREIALRSRGDANAPVAILATAKGSNCTAPAGFTGAIYRLNAELLSGMMTTPDVWKAMLEAASGALIVRDQSGFAAMLGLQNGDRIERANGIALRAPDDVAAAVLRPLTRSLPVTVIGLRSGQVRQWLYLNAGSCPS